MNLTKINDEVYYLNSDLITLDQEKILNLEAISAKNERRRGRICTHKNAQDIFQEMFIVHYKDTYVRPHFHITKVESFHVITGLATIFIFAADGQITQRIPLGDYHSGRSFYYRIDPNIIHSLVIESDVFIFHESTLGPFRPEDSAFPTWAPVGNNSEENLNFLQRITHS